MGLKDEYCFFFSASVLIKDRKEVVKDEAYQIQSLCLCDGDVNPDTHTYPSETSKHTTLKLQTVTNYKLHSVTNTVTEQTRYR